MKLKFLMIAAAMVALVSCGPSYRVTDHSTIGITVPASIQSSFTSQYPAAADVAWSNYDAATTPIDWELAGWRDVDQSAYVAVFTMDNEKYFAWYDANGDWLGSAYVMTDYKSLPPAVNSVINDKYSGYTISSVHREFQKDKAAYEIQLNNGDQKAKLLIDENGNIIKEKTK